MPMVSIQGTDKIFEVKEGQVIYDSLSDQGYDLPHGCLAGSCGACKIEVTSGEKNLIEAGVIESNTIEAVRSELEDFYGVSYVENKVVRLSCRAKVKGDIVIKPIKMIPVKQS